jgi:hypothetical protein
VQPVKDFSKQHEKDAAMEVIIREAKTKQNKTTTKASDMRVLCDVVRRKRQIAGEEKEKSKRRGKRRRGGKGVEREGV